MTLKASHCQKPQDLQLMYTQEPGVNVQEAPRSHTSVCRMTSRAE